MGELYICALKIVKEAYELELRSIFDTPGKPEEMVAQEVKAYSRYCARWNKIHTLYEEATK